MWHKALDQSEVARVTFVDFSKAFDRVDHTVVINNLIELAIPRSVIKWFASFITNRQQRVKIASTVSTWLVLKGGMPQGSWLGPLTFVILIDKLKLSCLTHKYIDDTTMTEILSLGQTSQMAGYMNELYQWSLANNMQINKRKTKEMVITSSHSVSVPLIPNIERVETFKLLGIVVSSGTHTLLMLIPKANSRLHLLRQLKRAAVPQDDNGILLYWHHSPGFRLYAVAVWHTGLTADLSDQLELIKR